MMPTTSADALASAESALRTLEAANLHRRQAEITASDARQTEIGVGRVVFARYQEYNRIHREELRLAILQLAAERAENARLEAEREERRRPLVVPDAAPFRGPGSPILMGAAGRASPPPLVRIQRRRRVPISRSRSPSPASSSGNDADFEDSGSETESEFTDDDIYEMADDVEDYLDQEEELQRYRGLEEAARERAQRAVINVLRERIMDRLDGLPRNPEAQLPDDGLPIARRLVRRIRGSYLAVPIDLTD